MKKLFSKAYWAEYFFPKHAEELALLRDEIRRLNLEITVTNKQKDTLLAIINGAVKPDLRPQSQWFSSPSDIGGIQPVSPPPAPVKPEVQMFTGGVVNIPVGKRKNHGWFTGE